MRHDQAAQMFERAKQLIEGASSIAVSGHTDPDGDALGSVLGMVGIINAMWPDKAVQPLLANDRAVPANLAFLPGAEALVPAARYEGAPDLFISVDTPTRKRLADSAAVLERSRASLCLDHHPAVEESCDECYTDPESAACADIVLAFARYLGCPISQQVATCLFTACATDTGSFQFQNTSPKVLQDAAALVQAGAKPAEICLKVYQSKTFAQLKLQQVVLERLSLACDDELATSYVLQSDFERLGAASTDCDGLVDCIRTLGGPRAVLFLREQGQGGFRGNLRSKDESRDVSLVARAFGGGGHKMAAGFSVEGPIESALAALTASYDELCRGGDVR